MKKEIGLPFLVKSKNHNVLMKLINKLKNKYGFIQNNPINPSLNNGTHGDYGCNWAFINIENKSYWLGMPGVKLSSTEFSISITEKDFIKILRIFLKNLKKNNK